MYANAIFCSSKMLLDPCSSNDIDHCIIIATQLFHIVSTSNNTTSAFLEGHHNCFQNRKYMFTISNNSIIFKTIEIIFKNSVFLLYMLRCNKETVFFIDIHTCTQNIKKSTANECVSTPFLF